VPTEGIFEILSGEAEEWVFSRLGQVSYMAAALDVVACGKFYISQQKMHIYLKYLSALRVRFFTHNNVHLRLFKSFFSLDMNYHDGDFFVSYG